MEKETTYRKITETRYTFTADDIKRALITQYLGGLVGEVTFWIGQPIYDDTEFHAQIVVERTIAVDDGGPVLVAT